MNRGPVVLVLGLAACGGVSSSPIDAPPLDAAIDAPPPRCNPTAPFGSPTPLTTINTSASEESAWLSPDELTIYFSSTRTGTVGLYDLFRATRTSTAVAFGSIEPVPGVNTTGHERSPQLSADQLNLYALVGAAPDYDIALAQRSSTDASFGPLAVVANLNSTSNDEPGTVLPDHRAMYLDSDRGTNGYDLYRSVRTGGQFSPPALVSGDMLNTAATEAGAIVTPDELTLFFVSDRPGGLGSSDIYVATRASTADAFGAPINLQILNTATIDGVSWVSADGCVVYLTSGDPGAYDLFAAQRGM